MEKIIEVRNDKVIVQVDNGDFEERKIKTIEEQIKRK